MVAIELFTIHIRFLFSAAVNKNIPSKGYTTIAIFVPPISFGVLFSFYFKIHTNLQVIFVQILEGIYCSIHV